jgi:ribosomal protein S18 acetylase RimI-like enzyme
MDKIIFNKAGSEDSELLAQFVNAAYRGESSKQGWTTEADILGGQRTDADCIQALIEQENNVILIARSENQICGCVNLERKNSSLAYLGMLTVAPEIQAKGLGRKILAEAEKFVMQEWNIFAIEMTVFTTRVELIAWYERRGYEVTNEKRPFYYGDERFGIPKFQDLEFVVLRKKLPH